jgi:quercetin dioxygenase-like cupin family protein
MSVAPGGTIPLHSHADPEVFYMLEGTLEFLQYDGDAYRWPAVKSGEVICVPSHAKHAIAIAPPRRPSFLLPAHQTPTTFSLRSKRHFLLIRRRDRRRPRQCSGY